MKLQSLAAALGAFLLLVVGFAGLRFYSQEKLGQHFDQLALANIKTSRLGLFTDEGILQRKDYLPVYGSCELVYPQRNRIDHFFADRPTGFRVSPDGDRGVTSLLMAERFAALGEQLRGKRLIVILSPEWFFRAEANDPTYDGNFSVEHALAALSSSTLNPAIKQRLSARMADYPETLQKNPFLAQLAAAQRTDSPAGRAVRPIINAFAGGYLDLQQGLDPICTYLGLKRSLTEFHVNLPEAQRKKIDWDHDVVHSFKEFQRLSGDNPYGFRDTLWAKVAGKPRTYFFHTSDRNFAARLRDAREWEDYDLMLAILKQYGANVLVISTPINARYLEALGVSRNVWWGYYDGIQKVAQKYDFPLVDFRHFEDDTKFFGFADPNPEGWIYINHVADAFFHGHLNHVTRTL